MSRPTASRECRALLAMLAAGLVLGGCSGGGGVPSDDPAPAVGTSPAGESADGPVHLSGSDTALDAGTYQASFLSESGPVGTEALLDVPQGYLDGDDWYVVSEDGDTFLGLWVVTTVDRDACRLEDRDAVDPGASVQDLASALVAQRSTRAATPEPVTVAGHEGVYVELTAPADLTRCDPNPALWRSPERPIYGGGQVDRVWILDMDGQRLVLDASYARTATAQERKDLTSMVESLELVPSPRG